MKITFHVFSLFALLSVFSTISWASDVNPTSEAKLAENKDDGEYFINMQTSGKASLAITEDQIAGGITSFKIYDDGGKNGNYSNGVDHAILDIVVPKGYKMELTGNVFLKRIAMMAFMFMKVKQCFTNAGWKKSVTLI